MSVPRLSSPFRQIRRLNLNHWNRLTPSSHSRFFCTAPKDHERNPDNTQASEQDQSNQESPRNESKTNSEKSDGDEELKVLYDATLLQVQEHGWTDRAIEAAVAELGWSPAAKRMISRGPAEVVEEFVARCNKELAETLAMENEKDAAAAGGSEPVGRATYAMRTRLEKLEPYHHNWARALALQALPQNSPRAFRSTALLVDEFAHYAGYRSTDVSFVDHTSLVRAVPRYHESLSFLTICLRISSSLCKL